jgi:crotonobetainyl-CoA:carnitine CoA-transferase CaiB-like acyl-CoA transferase
VTSGGSASSGAPGPLAGIRVLDLTRVLAGPFATLILADLGAEVIKIEDPHGGDQTRSIPPFYEGGESHYFIAINRGKKSVAVDLKTASGKTLVLALASKSDVVIENFRPGVADRLGIGYEALVASNPNIVMCSISGFGSTGPMRNSPSFDLVTQALSGVMSITGDADGPPTKMGLPMGDLGGGLWGAISVLAALNRRHALPGSQHIDLSLLEGLMGLLGYIAQLTLMTGDSPGRVGSGHHSVVPYGRYEVEDGYLVLALHVGDFWRRFCKAAGAEKLMSDPRFRSTADRWANREELQRIVRSIMRTRTREDWLTVLAAGDVPHAPILDVAEALTQQQIVDRRLIATMHHPAAGEVEVLRSPIRFAGDPVPHNVSPAPMLGEHTRRVLKELLYMSDKDINSLVTERVVIDGGTDTGAEEGN